MSEQNKIQLFENQPIRTAWNEEQEEWYFSVVDVIHVLTGSENPRRYWSDLKRKLKSEGATQLYENIVETKNPEKSRQKAAGCRNTQEVIYTQPLFITPFYLLKGYRSDRLDINIPVIPKAARRDGFTR